MTYEEKHALEIECAAIVDEYPECIEEDGECIVCGPNADPNGRCACRERVDCWLSDYLGEIASLSPSINLLNALHWVVEEYSFPWHESPEMTAEEYIEAKGGLVYIDQP